MTAAFVFVADLALSPEALAGFRRAAIQWETRFWAA
jgi:hypothetical protein